MSAGDRHEAGKLPSELVTTFRDSGLPGGITTIGAAGTTEASTAAAGTDITTASDVSGETKSSDSLGESNSSKPPPGVVGDEACSNTWPCPQCTFENSISDPHCDCCGFSRPAKDRASDIDKNSVVIQHSEGDICDPSLLEMVRDDMVKDTLGNVLGPWAAAGWEDMDEYIQNFNIAFSAPGQPIVVARGIDHDDAEKLVSILNEQVNFLGFQASVIPSSHA